MALFWACVPAFDASRQITPSRSVGDHVYELFCDRLAQRAYPDDHAGVRTRHLCRDGSMPPAGAPAALRALHAARPRLIRAIDQTVQGPHDAALRDDLAAALPGFLDLLDPPELEALRQATQRGLQALLDEPGGLEGWAAPPPPATALRALGRQPDGNVPLLGVVAADPSFADLLRGSLQHLNDPGDAAARAFDALQGSLHHQLRAATPLPSLAAWQPFLSSPRAAVVQRPGDPTSPWAMTPLAGLLEQLQRLLRDAPASLPAALQTAVAALAVPSTGGAAPLPHFLELVERSLSPGGQAAAAAALGALGSLGRSHEAALAELAALRWASPAAGDPAVARQLANELIDWLAAAAAVPGLLEDVAGAFTDPRLHSLGPVLAAQMRHRDAFTYDRDDLNAAVLGDYRTPLDGPPGSPAGRSVWARLLHLVDDSRQPLCNPPFAFVSHQYGRCEFFKVDDAAQFYLRAMVGQAHLTLRFAEDDEAMRDMMEEVKENGSSAVIGFDHAFLLPPEKLTAADVEACERGASTPFACTTFLVTPPAASRMLFAVHDPLVDEAALGGTIALMRQITEDMQVDGQSIGVRHPGTLFAWEKDDFAGRVAPLVQAFVRHDQGALLLDLLGLVHRHWDAGATLSRSAAPLATLLGEAQGLNKLSAVLVALQGIRQAGGDGIAALTGALRQSLQPVVDGSSAPQQAPRLLHAALDLFEQLTVPGVAPSGAIYEALWGCTEATPKGRAFCNRAGYQLALAALEAAAAPAGSQAAAPGLQSWLGQPVVHDAAALLQALSDDPAILDAALALADHLLADHFDVCLTACGAAVQALSEPADHQPLYRAMATWVAPQTGAFARALGPLHRLWSHDSAAVLPRLLAALHRPLPDAPPGETPLRVLGEVVAQLGRCAPEATEALTAADYAAIVEGLQMFLSDPEHGMARLLVLLQRRGTA